MIVLENGEQLTLEGDIITSGIDVERVDTRKNGVGVCRDSC